MDIVVQCDLFQRLGWPCYSRDGEIVWQGKTPPAQVIEAITTAGEPAEALSNARLIEALDAAGIATLEGVVIAFRRAEYEAAGLTVTEWLNIQLDGDAAKQAAFLATRAEIKRKFPKPKQEQEE